MSSIETIHTNNLSQVKHIDGRSRSVNRSRSESIRGRKHKGDSFQDPSPTLARMGIKGPKQVPFKMPFHDPSTWAVRTVGNEANRAPFKTLVYTPSRKNAKQVPFKTQSVGTQKGQNKLISRPFKTLASPNGMYDNKSSFQDLSRPLYQTIANRVKALNSEYYLPTHKHTKVITDP